MASQHFAECLYREGSLRTFTALADGRSSIMVSPGPFSIHQDLSVTIRNAALLSMLQPGA